MKTLFLVSSAIHTVHGVFSAEERLNQTIDTLKSITAKIPDAQIIVSDSGAEAALSENESLLIGPHLTGLINYNDDKTLQQIYKLYGKNFDIVKNFTEMIVTCKTLDFILAKQPQMLNGIDRVFKLSGRYLLSDSFNIENFNKSNKYIFCKRRLSQFPPQTTGGLIYQLMSRLWSWDAKNTSLVLSRYNLMIEEFTSSLDINQYKDIEHLLLKYFDGPNLLELPTIGVEGKLGPNGNVVKD